jgi:thioredoxin 1
MSVINLSDFEATEKFTQLNHKSVLYFTATWCPPCKAIKPVYEELAGKYKDVAFGKVDVDDNSDAALEFNITSVPTFVFFDGEDIIERFSGADPTKLESILQDLNGR